MRYSFSANYLLQSRSTLITYMQHTYSICANSKKRAIRRLLTAVACLPAAMLMLITHSCVTEDVYTDTASGTFEALWQTVDENYCFFQLKKDSFGVDWDSLHTEYATRINSSMDNYQLFEVCADMLNELRDGHNNIAASHDVSAYAEWADGYPTNYSDTLERIYLGATGEYRVASGVKYKLLKSNIGYMRVEDMSYTMGSGNLNEVMLYLASASGLIVDVRSNSGGLLTTAEKLASLFYNEPTTIGYIGHKTGRGRNDFSTPTAITIDPFEGLRWQKPVVILTNRRVYSAANSFVGYVRYADGVTIMGDRTGGGGGMPLTKELPNGWSVRVSASPLYDARMNSLEPGIYPDISVGLTSRDFMQGIDTMIEAAIAYLIQQTSTQ